MHEVIDHSEELLTSFIARSLDRGYVLKLNSFCVFVLFV